MSSSMQRWPATAKMRAMFNQGLTFDEIADRVEEMEGWRPTRSGVKRKFDAMGMPPRRPATAKALIPWRVKQEHNRHRYRHMLEAESRRRRHAKLSGTDHKLLSSMNNLLYGRGTLLVIDYDWDAGWSLRDREDDDTDIIRAPRKLEVLRLEVQAQIRNAQTDQERVKIAQREGLLPAVLASGGYGKAAELLRTVRAEAAEAEEEPSLQEVHDVAAGFADAVRSHVGGKNGDETSVQVS